MVNPLEAKVEWVWDGNYEAMKHNSLPQKPTLLFPILILKVLKEHFEGNSYLPRVPHLFCLAKGCTTPHPSSVHLFMVVANIRVESGYNGVSFKVISPMCVFCC